VKFRKKPVVVVAERYTGPHVVMAHEVPPPSPDGVRWTPPAEHSGYRWPYVITAHGHEIPVAPGDWIIAEPDGRGYYPCKPDIFEATYEPVEVTS
jgi:hypothetical protein